MERDIPHPVKLRLSRSAHRDLEKVVRFYHRESPDLRFQFEDALESALKHVLLNPHAWQLVEDDTRRILLKGFPYFVYYIVEQDVVAVVAVVHTKRHPGHWRQRRRS